MERGAKKYMKMSAPPKLNKNTVEDEAKAEHLSLLAKGNIHGFPIK